MKFYQFFWQIFDDFLPFLHWIIFTYMIFPHIYDIVPVFWQIIDGFYPFYIEQILPIITSNFLSVF